MDSYKQTNFYLHHCGYILKISFWRHQMEKTYDQAHMGDTLDSEINEEEILAINFQLAISTRAAKELVAIHVENLRS